MLSSAGYHVYAVACKRCLWEFERPEDERPNTESTQRRGGALLLQRIPAAFLDFVFLRNTQARFEREDPDCCTLGQGSYPKKLRCTYTDLSMGAGKRDVPFCASGSQSSP